jgi:hypothetical protein
MTTKRAFWLPGECGWLTPLESSSALSRWAGFSAALAGVHAVAEPRSPVRRYAGAGRGSGRWCGLFLARKRHSARSSPNTPHHSRA